MKAGYLDVTKAVAGVIEKEIKCTLLRSLIKLLFKRYSFQDIPKYVNAKRQTEIPQPLHRRCP